MTLYLFLEVLTVHTPFPVSLGALMTFFRISRSFLLKNSLIIHELNNSSRLVKPQRPICGVCQYVIIHMDKMGWVVETPVK